MAERSQRRSVARRCAVVLAGVLLTLTGCGVVPAYGTKAGGGVVPRHIIVATTDPPGRPASDDVKEFAHAIDKLSDGAISVEILWQAHTRVTSIEDPHAYETVGKMVRSGKVELALLPDFVWAEQGATRLAALKAPFLVTSDALVTAIATSALSGPMLDELSRFGVHGLALLPETLRHPVGFGGPLRTLADIHGQSLRSVDPYARRLFDTLGAHGVAIDGNGFAAAVSQGLVQGADSAFAQFASLPTTGTFTGNVTYFPKVNVLAASNGWFDRLDPGTRAIIESAARDTLHYVVRTNPSDAESARRYCAEGGSVVVADSDSVGAIEQAAAPIRAALERNAQTRATIDGIRNLKDGLPPAADQVAACGPAPDAGDTSASAPGPDDTSASPQSPFPQGTYRMEITKEAFLAAGVDEATAIDHAGIWTITFRDGKYLDPGCPGSTYTVQGGRVSVVLGTQGPGCGGAAGAELFSARWSYNNGILRFLEVRGGSGGGTVWQALGETLWGSQPWQRIG
jgi:TRAP-type C4-dicarboxylate transport system substrate-binding protein